MTDFTVMNWNVQNLLSVSHEDGSDNVQAFNSKVASLAAVINQESPDVLALQEVGSREVLTQLQASLNIPMPNLALGDPDRRGIRVAFLSTLPISSITHIRPYPPLLQPVQSRDFVDGINSTTNQMGRGSLQIVVDVDGTEVTLITSHFKSKLNTYPRPANAPKFAKFIANDEGERSRYTGYGIYRRSAEAVTIREHINQLLGDPLAPTDVEKATGREKAVIFCGDLNDEIGAATTQIIQGEPGSSMGQPRAFSQPDRFDGFRMWNIAYLIPGYEEGEVFTRIYKGRHEIIDHIFASHKLVNPDNLPTVHTVMNPDPLPNMGDDPNARQNKPGSDHAALVAKFTV